MTYPGYQDQETIYEGRATRVLRARRLQDGQPVILKTLKSDYPAAEDRARLRLEHDILRGLDDPGVVRALDLLSVGHNLVLVLEDIGASSLEARADYGHLDPSAFLDLAIQMAGILGRIHRQGLIHKDVNPANFVYNPETGRLQIIDFDLASRLDEERVRPGALGALEGTLPYIAPEQTGRMNRNLDWRADFYSLGATFHELLTGRPPFVAADALELIHQHLAVPPPSVRSLRPELPEPLADIILRLLAKSAEDRYLGAYGLIQDLERCRRELASGGEPRAFTLAQRDVSDRFHIPQKLYGRERDLRRLLEAFERASGGRAELMLVSGEPGIGKSVLVNEVQGPMVGRRGHVVTGKFDQLQRNVPYSALAQAFGDLMRQILGARQADIEAWRERLQAGLQPNGQLIIDVIPDLALVIGDQPAVPALGGREARNRFNLVFQAFAQALARPEHPLVLFIDDLQWADLASLEVLETVLGDSRMAHLLVIGAYRDNEVHSGHPLSRSLERIREAGTIIDEIKLQALDDYSLTDLVADATLTPASLARGLADLVQQKTGGNPFFVRQFLRHLIDEGQLRFDEERGGWTWDIDHLRGQAITENVVAFVVRQILKLDAPALEALQLAACIGASFDLATLSLAAERGPEEMTRALVGALEAGLVLPAGSAWRRFLASGVEAEGLDASRVIFHFAHDRIQQAAYSSLPAPAKKEIHLRIGRGLEGRLGAGGGEDRFAMVAHLNLARDLLTDEAERRALVMLNRGAGQQAMASAAYDAAYALFTAALELLPADAWVREPELGLTLHQDVTDAACASQQFAAALEHGQIVISRAEDPLVAAQAYWRMIEVHIAQHANLDAIRLGLEGMSRLGIELPADPTDADSGAALQATAEALRPYDVAALLDLPLMTDPRTLGAMRLAMLVVVPCAFVSGNQFVSLTTTMVRQTLTHGLAPASAFGFVLYSNILCGPLKQHPLGYRFGRLALDLVEKLDLPDLSPMVTLSFETSVRHWVDHLGASLAPLLEAYRLAISQADFGYAALCAVNHCTQLHQAGRPLDQVLATMMDLQAGLERIKQSGHVYAILIERAAVEALGRRDRIEVRLVGAAFDEQRELPKLREAGDLTHLVQVDMAKAMLATTFGDFKLSRLHALTALETVFETGWRATHYPQLTCFHGALGILNAPSADPEGDRRDLDRCLEALGAVAATGPMNYGHKLALVQAEQARLEGRVPEAMGLYDRAIEGAREQGFLQDEALAAELAGQFYLGRGHGLIAEAYLAAAYRGYQAWGAMAKLQQLRNRHSFLRGVAGRGSEGEIRETTRFGSLRGGTDRFSSIKGETLRGSGQGLDLAAVIKAGQAISGEIELDRLLATLLAVTVEAAGADAGALLVLREGQPLVAAACRPGESVQVLDHLPLDDSDHLAPAVPRYVLRSGKTVLIADVQAPGQFRGDRTLQARGIRSLLCLPIGHHGAVTALLYLENREVAGAFTPDRLEILGLLSGQAAISLENARLYRERSDLIRAYARFVPESFLSHLGKGSITEVALGDQAALSMTVLVSDIRGFTARSEFLAVGRSFDLLNDYLGRMVPLIEASGGVVDKYMGDAIMALFPEPGGADVALQVALGMLERLGELNRDLAARGEAPLEMGIGLHTGTVMLGTIGSAARMDGTAIGDTVNLASRVEGVTKRYGISLALSDATHDALSFPSNYLLRRIDRVQVLGRGQAVDVYEVFEADPPQRVARKRENLARIAEAVAAYQAHDFAACEAQCRLAMLLDPEDEVAAMYVRRCELIREHGLPPDGELVAVLTEK